MTFLFLFAILVITPLQNEGLAVLSSQKLGIGTWAWGDKFFWGYDSSQDDDLEAVYNECLSVGITLFDTAEIYGFGRSELLLGRFNRRSKSDTKPVLATKFAPLPWRFQAKDVVNACKDSLDRFGVDQIDLYQIHFPGILNEAYWNGLADCIDKGLVKSVGVSNYGPLLLRSAYRSLKDRGIELESNQIQYSLLCRQQEMNGAIQTAKELNITTLAYSPLAQGILTGKFSSGLSPAGPRSSVVRAILPKVTPLLTEIKSIADTREKTMAQVLSPLIPIVC